MNLVTYIISKADEALEESGNKHGYYYTLQALAKHISLYSGKNTKLQQVDKDYILGFNSYLKTAKNFNYKRTGTDRDKEVYLGQNTQHNLFMKFKYVLKKAVQADVITVNPMDKLDKSEKPKEKDSATREFLTLEDIKKLIKTRCKNDMIKRAFLFCCLVGLRYSDVANITWGELEICSNRETILRFKKKNSIIDTAYNGKNRLGLCRNQQTCNPKTGIISRRAVDLVLAKCEGLHIKQSVWGGIFGFGTITVTTGGVTSSYPFIADPLAFRREINTQIG